MTFPLPKSKAGQCFLLSEPTSLPLQPHELHHPVVAREKATTGDAELLPMDKWFFAIFSLLLSQFTWRSNLCL